MPTPATTHPSDTDRAPALAPQVNLADILSFPVFIAECERSKVATKGQLAWWARFRHENGLTKSGALIERRPNPKSHRPLLFVNRQRFAEWLAGVHTNAM